MIVGRERGAVSCGVHTSEPGIHSPKVGLSGAPLSRPARVGVRCKRASLELQRLGVNAPSDYRQKRHAAHRLTFVPLPDFPVGVLRTELLATYNRSAATVTQAGGLNGLPAFSSFVQASAHPVTVDTPRNSEAGRGERCRLVSGLEPVGGMEAWGTW